MPSISLRGRTKRLSCLAGLALLLPLSSADIVRIPLQRKAVETDSIAPRDALLAHAAASTGRGRAKGLRGLQEPAQQVVTIPAALLGPNPAVEPAQPATPPATTATPAVPAAPAAPAANPPAAAPVAPAAPAPPAQAVKPSAAAPATPAAPAAPAVPAAPAAPATAPPPAPPAAPAAPKLAAPEAVHPPLAPAPKAAAPPTPPATTTPAAPSANPPAAALAQPATQAKLDPKAKPKAEPKAEPKVDPKAAAPAQPPAPIPLGKPLPLRDMFYGTIGIGSNQQNFSVMFDTGSANMWVPSSQCQASCENKHRYNNGDSKTFVKNGQPFSVMYGQGPVQGFYSQDEVTIANYTVKDQVFVEITQVDIGPDYKMAEFDGLVGMAFEALSTRGEKTIIGNLMAQNLVEDPVFAFYMADDGSGELTIGGADPKYYSGELFFVPVLRPVYWEVALDTVKMKDVVVNTTKSLILDSGTTLITGPPAEIAKMVQTVNAVPSPDPGFAWAVPNCTAATVFPELHFTISGKDFTLTRDNYVQKDPKGSNTCYILLIPADLGFWTLGQIFINKYYTVFDYGQKRVGLALAVPKPPVKV